ncbi:MAG: hypothetical protein D6691_01795 [Candidatus Hydrogenedentota bacterium]|jgi:endonuclease/exonuclease/phosphatase family metal-dependent hydrolase|nr:MAG: hypothetical protein D6691_01795 [Candidatus Hydrogenedentota bacterium]GIX44443.1 MAG: endonuclease [Candidatus Sumerlaea sp.]
MIQRLLEKKFGLKERGATTHRRQGLSAHDAAPQLLLRVLTYNIHHGRGTDRKVDLDRIAQVIAHENPDIVAIQEIERFRHRTQRVDQPRELAQKLGMNVVFARVRDHRTTDHHSHAAYGNAILSRFPIKEHNHYDLTFSKQCEPRGCLHARIEAMGISLHVFCVHLGLRWRERDYQIARLMSDEVLGHPRFHSGPRILLGDFNNWFPVKSARLLREQFKDACRVTGRKRINTFGHPITYLSLDYVFVSPEITVLSCDVSRQRLARLASDHRPLVCQLAVPMVLGPETAGA